jgi:hypothetical protein
MTIHALLGLGGLNLLYLVCGGAVLWLVRGWKTWLELARLGGLAYLLGVVSAGGVWTLLLIADVPFSGWLILLTPVVFLAAAGGGGRWLGRPRPELGATGTGVGVLVAACGIAAVGLFLEALFRRARLAGLYNWDAWSFWVPKGKAIYFFDRLDEGFFAALPGPSYPPLVPVLDAAAFHAMGGVDVTTLHLQFWFLGAGFVWAFAGVLSERVPGWILWPFVALPLVAPRIGPRFTIPEADLLLDFLFVLAAILVLFWLLHRERWRLVAATVLLCGLVLTKREGVLLAAFVVAGAFLVSVDRKRETWPALGLTVLAVAAVGAPWRVWYLVHGIENEGPSGGVVQSSERLWPSLRLAFDVLFASGYWSLLVPMAIGSLVVAALAREGRLVAYFAALIGLVTLGGGWITWAVPELEITQELGANPIVRYMGAGALLCAAASPILLAAAWRAATGVRDTDGASRHPRGNAQRTRFWLAVAVALVPLVGYPIVTLAGGGARFPSRHDCVRAAVSGEPVDVVYGRFDDPVAAQELLDRVLAAGFRGTQVTFDACGRWVVVLKDVPSLEVARGVREEAVTVGLAPTLELGSDS